MIRNREFHVLFLCTGNSCRSQMAEGWVNHLGGAMIEARSAGIEAHGKNLHAIAVMREAGIDISNQESKKQTQELLKWADLVVTVCSHADQNCPVLPPGVNKRHWSIRDPAKATGKNEEIMAMFRKTRDDIRGRVESLIGDIQHITLE